MSSVDPSDTAFPSDTTSSAARVALASDLHLGVDTSVPSREREARFVAWLERAADGRFFTSGLPATEIHLVGDLFDFWFEYRRAVPSGHVRLLGTIARIADSGIPVHFHVGNHDLWTFGYLEHELGITVHRAPIRREYDGLRCLIGHGDGLGPGDAGYKRLKRLFTARWAQTLFRSLHPDLGLALAAHFSRSSRAATGNHDAIFRGAEHEWLHAYCTDYLHHHDIDCFLFGHRHLPLDLPVVAGVRSARYINLGDWLIHFTSVRIEHGVPFLLSLSGDPYPSPSGL